MCAIAGLFRLTGEVSSEDAVTIRQAIEALRHRGPDDEGFFADGHVALVHCRLSILDLSPDGRQPMSVPQRGIQVVFNGEIYNYRALRDELISHGSVFKSKTDTEVLLHGYLRWGFEGLLDRLRGMFALALYDPGALEGPQLLLARDRFGIKPLYYYQSGSHFIFSSEFRALSQMPMVPQDNNHQALARFLQLGSVPAPMTTLRNVFTLLPGHTLRVRAESVQIGRYWNTEKLFEPRGRRRPPSYKQAVADIRQRLEESIRMHLVSDVPTGIFLSGGIDSSALVALAGRPGGQALRTVSVIFEEADYNEAAYAHAVARHYRCQHQDVLIKENDFFDRLPAFFQAMDQPTVDGINSYSVSHAAKQAGLKVVLSGLGGDELFLGYSHFAKARWAGRVRHLLHLLPFGLQRKLLNTTIDLAKNLGNGSYQKLSYLTGTSPEEDYLLFRGLFNPAQIRDLLGITNAELRALCPTPRFGDLPADVSPMETVNALEFLHYLPNQLLRDTDVMSMAHSLEVRVPFLDHPFVDYVTGLPTSYKLRFGETKGLLVRALGKEFPKAVWDRPKKGFSFPMREWLLKRADELKEQASGHSWMDAGAVRVVWNEFRAGRLHWSRPWATLVAREFERHHQVRRLPSLPIRKVI